MQGKERTLKVGMFQIVHVDNNHWITISNICSRDPYVVQVYDTLGLNLSVTRRRLLLQMYGKDVSFQEIGVPKQLGVNHCGDYCSAISIVLAMGMNPAEVTFHASSMRAHLIKCLEEGKAMSFPIM